LIGAEGEQHGIVPTSQALEMAREAGLDLVEVAATERPQQKLKELRVRPKTGQHDIDTRINQARGFLEDGDKVLLRVQFRGREMQHIEEGRRIIDGMLAQLLDACKVEKPPSMEGKQMTALLAPKGNK
jgi:translation initiation factor IF-3